MPLPEELATAAGPGETWLTVRAELAADTAWAEAGHVVAWQQFDLTPTHRRRCRSLAAPPPTTCARPSTTITSGAAEFDAAPAGCRRLHELAVDGPRLELWRAPTDNDRS